MRSAQYILRKNSYSHSEYAYVAKVFESDIKSTPNFKNEVAHFFKKTIPTFSKIKLDEKEGNSK